MLFCVVCFTNGVFLRVRRQRLTGGLRSHEPRLLIRERFRQCCVRTGQTAHGGRKQVALQEQGPW